MDKVGGVTLTRAQERRESVSAFPPPPFLPKALMNIDSSDFRGTIHRSTTALQSVRVTAGVSRSFLPKSAEQRSLVAALRLSQNAIPILTGCGTLRGWWMAPCVNLHTDTALSVPRTLYGRVKWPPPSVPLCPEACPGLSLLTPSAVPCLWDE